jgi:hypothetical protein
MRDSAYEKPLRGWNAQSKEAAAIFVMGVAHAPLFPVAPFFTATVWYSMIRYHTVHQTSPAWPLRCGIPRVL